MTPRTELELSRSDRSLIGKLATALRPLVDIGHAANRLHCSIDKLSDAVDKAATRTNETPGPFAGDEADELVAAERRHALNTALVNAAAYRGDLELVERELNHALDAADDEDIPAEVRRIILAVIGHVDGALGDPTERARINHELIRWACCGELISRGHGPHCYAATLARLHVEEAVALSTVPPATS